MPLASMAQVQTDYNNGKTLAATVVSTYAAFAAALLALEQNNQALEADGAPSIAQWFRANAANLPKGYQVYGNMPGILVLPNNPNFARDLTSANSVGAVTSTDFIKNVYPGLVP